MKQVTIINKVIPAESRSKYGTSGRSSVISGGASVDLSPYLLKAIWERNFEERKDEAGNEYIYIKKPIVGAAGMTLFTGDEIKVDSIFKGLPIDTQTLQWVDGVLTVVGGTGGASNWDELEGKPSWITPEKPKYTWSEIEQKPSWITTEKPKYSYTEITGLVEELGKYVTLSTEQSVTGMKDFANGMKVSGILFKVVNGVLTLDCSIAVTGGITAYALGEQTAATIMEGVAVDGITITKEDGVLKVVGGGGASNWDELKGKPSWITDIKPVYAWGEITQKPTTLSGYGIQASDVLNVLKTVDGSGSGLDADTLDGKHYIDIINGNVASATKLQTARTIWGQSFDGTANITGSLTSVTDITGTGTFTGANIKATDSVYVNGIRLHKTVDGAVTIEGNLLVTGGITAYADGEDSGGTGGGVIVIDNLTSTLTDAALSANQGRVLKDLIDSKVSNWGELEGKPTTIAGYGITDAYTKTECDNRYVNVSGDTMTGRLNMGHNDLVFNASDSGDIVFANDDGTQKCRIYSNTNTLYLMPTSTNSASAGLVITNSTMTYKNNTIWHAGNDGSGSGMDADLLDGLDWNSFDLQRTYTINLNSYSSSNFYPVIFNQEYRELNCWINSPSAAASAAYNCNRIHFLYTTNGWSDFGNTLTILSRHNYDDGEITIGSIGRGTKGGGCIAVWLRGGLSYTFRCNRTPNLKTSNYTISEETYTVGTGISGGTNSNVDIIWTNDSNRTKYDLAAISSNVASATNADKLDGVHLNGIFTAFTTNGNNTRLTIGGVTKDLTVPYASNADMLDGVQLLQKGSTAGVMRSWARGTYTTVNQYFGNGVVVVIDPMPTDSTELWANTTIFSVGDTAIRNWQMAFGYGADTIKVRRIYNGPTYGNWKTLAYLDSNVASATKLQTPRTIWGQSFNGTANVSGNIIDTQAVKSKSGVWLDLYGANGVAFYTNNTLKAVITTSGNTGIGTTSPSEKLHVLGNILATGGGTFYSSDIRAKNVIESLKIKLNDIANSPVIKFKWNGYNGLKDDNKQHVGGIAQYIEKILPECVVGQKDDFLSFDYATTGYIFSVLTARHLLSYETRTDRIIRKLKERIKRLEKQLNIENHEKVCIVAD